MDDEQATCRPDEITPAETGEADRQAAAEAERKRVAEYDKPLEDDPVGNGIIGALGGGVAGFFRGGLGMAARMASSGSGWLTKTAKYLLSSGSPAPADGGGGAGGAPAWDPATTGKEPGTY